MTIVISLAAIAAASVVWFGYWSQKEPELAEQSTRRARELAAVVVVLCRAYESVLSALSGTARLRASSATYERWDDFERD